MKKSKKEKPFMRAFKSFPCDDGKHTINIGVLVEDETKYAYNIKGNEIITQGAAETKQEAFFKAVKEYQKYR